METFPFTSISSFQSDLLSFVNLFMHLLSFSFSILWRCSSVVPVRKPALPNATLTAEEQLIEMEDRAYWLKNWLAKYSLSLDPDDHADVIELLDQAEYKIYELEIVLHRARLDRTTTDQQRKDLCLHAEIEDRNAHLVFWEAQRVVEARRLEKSLGIIERATIVVNE